MGFFSKFESKVEDGIDGIGDSLGNFPINPVQISKKAEKMMRREKMVGAGKQHAPTLYTVLVNAQDDSKLFGYYPTLAGETETYLKAQSSNNGLFMDGTPLVRFIVDDSLKSGKFDVIAEVVAAPIIKQLRAEEMDRYGIGSAMHAPQVAPLDFAQASDQNFYNNDINNHNETNDSYEQNSAICETACLVNLDSKQSYTLGAAPTVIGRDTTANIQIPDSNISRAHAEIFLDATGVWVLRDLGSTNGSFVNGVEWDTTELFHCDKIKLGSTTFLFELS